MSGRTHPDLREGDIWGLMAALGYPIGPRPWLAPYRVARMLTWVATCLRWDVDAWLGLEVSADRWSSWAVRQAPAEAEGNLLPWYRRVFGQRVVEPEPSKVRTYRS